MQQVCVRELMSSPVISVTGHTRLPVIKSLMREKHIRRLPVVDGTELVGIVSQADIARALPDAKVGDLVGAISEAPSNS